MKKNALASEIQWLYQMQQNDTQALASLMDYYYQDLYNYGFKFTRDDGLIKDCIQEVFISLWQKRETAPAILSPRHYLLRAVKNKVLKALYKNEQKGYPFDVPDEYAYSQEFSIEKMIIEKQLSEEKAEKLKRVLSLLSKRQNEVIFLKFYQRLDNAQIAEQMDISRQSVYNLLHDAIQKLRSVWSEEFVTR